MSGERPLTNYKKMMQLKPETTKEEIREIYSAWQHDYDKVSVRSNAVVL